MRRLLKHCAKRPDDALEWMISVTLAIGIFAIAIHLVGSIAAHVFRSL